MPELVMAHKLGVYTVFAFDAHLQQMAGLGLQSLLVKPGSWGLLPCLGSFDEFTPRHLAIP